MTRELDLSTQYEQLCTSMGEPIATAVEVLALPHWFNEDLALEILGRFGNLNGDARSALAEVKGLPFVYPYESAGWRLVPSARAHFTAKLAARDHIHLDLNRLLVEYFDGVLKQMPDFDSREARETVWRMAYHLAPVKPEESVKCLHKLGERATARERLADMKAITDLVREQHQWLAAYDVDLLYFEGHYAYAQGRLGAAEACFAKVWERAEPSKMKAVAGHLLGVMWMLTKQKRDWALRAKGILAESLELGQRLGETLHQAMVLNSLGGALVKLGGRDNLKDARDAFECSLELGRQLGDTHHQAMALLSLGKALVKLGGRDNLEDARSRLERSLEILEDCGDIHGQAMVLNSLGGALVKLGGRDNLKDARDAFECSLEILEDLGDIRGQAMVLVSLSTWAETAGDKPRACSYMEQAIVLYGDLGLSWNVQSSQRRLDRLR